MIFFFSNEREGSTFSPIIAKKGEKERKKRGGGKGRKKKQDRWERKNYNGVQSREQGGRGKKKGGEFFF